MKNSAVRSSMVGICVRVRVYEAAWLSLRLSMRRHIIMEVRLEGFKRSGRGVRDRVGGSRRAQGCVDGIYADLG